MIDNERKTRIEEIVEALSEALFEGYRYKSIECVAIYDASPTGHRRPRWRGKWCVFNRKQAISKRAKAAVKAAIRNYFDQHQYRAWDDVEHLFSTHSFDIRRSTAKVNGSYFFELPISDRENILGTVEIVPAKKRVSIAIFQHGGIAAWEGKAQ